MVHGGGLDSYRIGTILFSELRQDRSHCPAHVHHSAQVPCAGVSAYGAMLGEFPWQVGTSLEQADNCFIILW